MREIRAFAIVLAAGVGHRFGAEEPKAFVMVEGRPMLSAAAAAAAASPAVEALVVTVPAGYEDRARALLDGLEKPVVVVTGAQTRQGSVLEALAAIPHGVEAVAIHDAARPFVRPELFTAVVSAVAYGAEGAIPVIPIADTVKRVRDGLIVATEPRDDLALAQTPQAFRVRLLREAHERAVGVAEFTDDAALLEWAGHSVCTVPGDPANIKITTPLDLPRVGRSLGARGV